MFMKLVRWCMVGAVTAGSAAAVANTYSLGLSLQAQWVGHTTKTETPDDSTSTSHDSRLKVVKNRLHFKGQPSSRTSFRLSTRFDRVGDREDSTGMSSTVDYAYLGYGFSDNFDLVIGKQASLHGGVYAGTFNPDRYFMSTAPAFAVFSRFSGLSAEWTLDSNRIRFRFGNADAGGESSAASAANQHAPGYGLVYEGDFGQLKPTLSYYGFPVESATETTTNTDGSSTTTRWGRSGNTALAAGAAWVHPEGYALGISYIDFTQGERKTVAASPVVRKENRTTSIILQGAYQLDELRPLVLYEMSSKKIADDPTSEQEWRKLAVVCEFIPKDGGGLSWYAAFVQAQEDVGQGSSKVSRVTEEWLFGARLNAAAVFASSGHSSKL